MAKTRLIYTSTCVGHLLYNMILYIYIYTYIYIYDIYLLQLGFHLVAAVDKFVKNLEKDCYILKGKQYTKQENRQTKNIKKYKSSN